MTLTDRQAEVLRDLDGAGWATPMEIGGRDQSHHAQTLAQLVRVGLVETKKLHAIYCTYDTHHVVNAMGNVVYVKKAITRCCCRGSRRYRITRMGLFVRREAS